MQTRTDDRRPVGENPEGDRDEIDLLALARTLWRGKIVIALCAIVAGGYGWYHATNLVDPQFRATASLAVNLQNSPAIDLGAVFSGVSGDQTSLNTEMEVIRSRALIGQLVDRLNLTANPGFNRWIAPPRTRFDIAGTAAELIRRVTGAEAPVPEPVPDAAQQREETITAVQEAITTSATRQSYLFSISATVGTPEDAVMIANTLAQVYRDDQIAQKSEATETAAVWLSERTAELGRDLDAGQAEINALQSQSALTTAAGVAALTTQATAAEARKFEADTALAGAEAAVARIEAAADASRSARAEAANDAQLRALVEAADGGDQAAVLRFDRRFEQVRAQAQIDRTRLAEAATTVAGEVAALSAQVATQNAALAEITQREEDLAATRLLYDTFLTRLKETSLQIGGHQADARILNEAVEADQVAPRKAMILAISLLLGLMTGAAIVLVREMLQNTFRTADDLEQRTGITVLGQVPRIPARTRRDTIAYLSDKPTSAAAEAIRNLRTSILLSNVDQPPRVILSTSSIPGEGKTTQAIALAQNLAGLDKKVILVEGDIRRRTFTDYFPEASKHPGVLSVISHKTPLSEAVWRHPVLKVDVLMGEKSSINAADVFSSESFRELMTRLREEYDYVILDTPPVLVVPDARVIAPLADAVIYTVNWDRTTRAQVAEGLKLLRTVNVNVTGLVLSQIDPKGMRRYGYGGHYGAYSRYARGYYEA